MQTTTLRRCPLAVTLTLLIAMPLAGFAQDSIDKVNGSITAEAGQSYGDLETVNGSVRIGDGAKVRDAETVNGSIFVDRGGSLDDISTVNGAIGLVDTDLSGGIETVSGDITVGVGSHVRGGIKVEKPNGNWMPLNMGKRKPPRIIIGPNAVVDGPLVFEREVTLYVHDSARTGAITGATAMPYSGTRAPKE